jgi:hypothetical protein
LTLTPRRKASLVHKPDVPKAMRRYFLQIRRKRSHRNPRYTRRISRPSFREKVCGWVQPVHSSLRTHSREPTSNSSNWSSKWDIYVVYEVLIFLEECLKPMLLNPAWWEIGGEKLETVVSWILACSTSSTSSHTDQRCKDT